MTRAVLLDPLEITLTPAVHSAATPQELDRLRRFCDAYGLTVDHLTAPDAEADGASFRHELHLSRADRDALGRASYRMGLRLSALVRGLFSAAIRDGSISRVYDYCADHGVSADELVQPVDWVRVPFLLPARHVRGLREAAMASGVPVMRVKRAIILAFLAEQRRQAA